MTELEREWSIGQAFLKDVEKHEMTILHDNGVYRHLRFAQPETSHYSFEIVTYPGTLVVTGDMGAYTFQRLHDMFNFFRGDYINPQYWGEKLVAHSRDDYRKYAPSDLEAYVKDHFENRKDEYSPEEQVRLWEELEGILGAENEYEAHEALRNFEDEETGYRFEDSWEANLWHYALRYLWILHAIRYSVDVYHMKEEATRLALIAADS